MSEQKTDNRVLGRRGARILNDKECELANGGLVITAPCTFDARTCKLDGVCEVPVKCP